jgi:hypothetical protein
MKMHPTVAIVFVLLTAGALLPGCQGPPLYERVPEPAHASQDSLLHCPHCDGFGLVECQLCIGKGGWVCPTCEGFGIAQCPDCKVFIAKTDYSPERDLYYQLKTFGGEGTGVEAFDAKVFADWHLHGIDRRNVQYMSSSILAGKRCKTCNSRGVVTCPDCGSGIRACRQCGAKMYEGCPLCKGSGYVPSLSGEKVKARGIRMRKRKRAR